MDDKLAVYPVTPDRWEDFERLFGKQGAYFGCWCMWWRVSGKDFKGRTGAQNKADMKAIIESGSVPGLLAYDGDRPVGWCSVAPRTEFAPRFNKFARVYRPIDDQEVWSILCFYVAADRRGQGVAARLLEAAVEYAREQGAPMLEAYARTTDGETPISKAMAYTGTDTMYRSVGFEEVARPHPVRAVMRLKL